MKSISKIINKMSVKQYYLLLTYLLFITVLAFKLLFVGKTIGFTIFSLIALIFGISGLIFSVKTYTSTK